MRIRSLPYIAALATAIACGRKDAGESEGEKSVAVQTEVVGTQSFTESIGAIGVVTGRPGHMAAIAAPAPARIARVMVAVGQHVDAGDTLIELDGTQFTGALRSADAALTAADRNYERTKRLADSGIAPRKDVEVALADLERARAEAATAHRAQELSLMRAPIAGVVTRVNATLAAMADPSQALVEIADGTSVDVLFSVTPTQAALIHRGARVTLSAGQSSSGESLGAATVIDVSGVVDTSSRGVTVRAQAPEAKRSLRIGETVYGEIVASVRPNAVVVPINALVPEGEGFKVFVVDDGGVAHEREVTVGGRTAKYAEITEGLKKGERVVTYGAYGMEDSVKVAPMKPAESKEP